MRYRIVVLNVGEGTTGGVRDQGCDIKRLAMGDVGQNNFEEIIFWDEQYLYFCDGGARSHEYSKFAGQVAEIACKVGKLALDIGLISVVTRNTAHQMAYVLSEKCLLAAGDGLKNTLVINIDQHEDYSAATYRSNVRISSVSWGGVSSVNNVYAVFGTSRMDDLNKIFTTMLGNGLKPMDVTTFISNLNNYNIYITIDLDVLAGNETQYKKGLYTVDNIKNFLNQVFVKFATTDNRLVGIDITGLPLSSDITSEEAEVEKKTIAWTQANDIIKYIIESVGEESIIRLHAS